MALSKANLERTIDMLCISANSMKARRAYLRMNNTGQNIDVTLAANLLHSAIEDMERAGRLLGIAYGFATDE